MNYIDSRLDRITMYRLLVLYLEVLLGAAMLLSALGFLSFNPLSIAFSAGFLVGICLLANRIFASVFNAPANPESSLITALILALIITPPASIQGYVFLTAAAGLAIASKYLLTIRGRHIFNPAAVAVALTAIAAGESASLVGGQRSACPGSDHWRPHADSKSPARPDGGILCSYRNRRNGRIRPTGPW